MICSNKLASFFALINVCLSELIHIFSDYAFVHVLLFSIIFICIARSSYPKVIPTTTFVARVFQYINSYLFIYFIFLRVSLDLKACLELR